MARPTDKSFSRVIARQPAMRSTAERIPRSNMSGMHCRSLKPGLIFRYHMRPRDHANSISPVREVAATHCSSDGDAQSVLAARPRLLPGISICFPSVKRRRNASRRVSSRANARGLLSAARYGPGESPARDSFARRTHCRSSLLIFLPLHDRRARTMKRRRDRVRSGKRRVCISTTEPDRDDR